MELQRLGEYGQIILFSVIWPAPKVLNAWLFATGFKLTGIL